MNRIFYTLTIGAIITLTSCRQIDPNKNVDEGQVQGNLYTSNEIGWTIEIPKGWTIVDKEMTKEQTEKGVKAIEETLDGDIDFSRLKNLISFKKNLFNIFQSTSEPFELQYEGEWEENNTKLKKILYLTYQNQGIEADSTSTEIENIDGLEFQKYVFTIYSPKGEAILRQMMYSRLINGLDFGVAIIYNNDKDRDELLKVFRNSKFKKN